MGRYADFLNRIGSSGAFVNPLRVYNAYNDLYDSAHGGERYALSQFPIGRIRQFQDNYKRWEDTYNNTGLDPVYSGQYGSGGIPFVNDTIGAVTKPVRMVSSLAKMYGAEVELDISWLKYKTSVQNGKNADKWIDFQKLKNGVWY